VEFMSGEKVTRRDVVKLAGATAAGLVVGGLGGWFGREGMISPTPTNATMTVKPALSGQITIGIIHAVPEEAGPAQPAYDIALEEINAFCAQSGIDATFVARVEGAEGTPTKALERFNALVGSGIQLVMSPTWSGMNKVLLDPANAAKVVLISAGSTSPQLAIPNDYLFRICPDDNQSSLCLNKFTAVTGIKAVIAGYATDAYGTGVWGANQKRWTDLGLKFIQGIPLDPSKNEYIGEAGTADSYYAQALKAGYKPNEIAIFYFGSLHVPWLTGLAKYPELVKGPGVGPGVFDSDGAGEPVVVQFAPEIASKVQYAGYSFAPSSSSKFADFATAFQTKAGYPPNWAWSATGYDGLWIGALSVLCAGNSGPAIQKILPSVASSYYGATGWCVLNDAGDRKYPSYNFQRVVIDNSVVKWVTYGHYDGSADTITWSNS